MPPGPDVGGNDKLPTDVNVVLTPNAVVSPNLTVPVVNANPNLSFIGRFDTSAAGGPIMSWPGTKILAGFSGTSLTLNMRAVDQQTYYMIGNVDNYISVSIDGGSPSVTKIAQGINTYVLASKLAAGNHTVEITKRTEAQIGSLQFLGFTLDTGATLVPGLAPRTRRLQFVGDSGTVGYGAEGNWAVLPHCSFTPQTENAQVAYPMVAASLLKADVHVIGNSGKGVYQNRDTVNDTYYTLPTLWTLTSGDTLAQPADANATAWNASSWTPDAVVIVVGGNDFAASTPPAASYNTTAVKFLRAVRAAHPNAWIFVMISPMLDPPVAGQSRPSTSELGAAYAKTMVATLADSKVSYLSVDLDDGSRGYGCDYHMNVASHRMTGTAVAAAIAATLGWK